VIPEPDRQAERPGTRVAPPPEVVRQAKDQAGQRKPPPPALWQRGQRFEPACWPDQAAHDQHDRADQDDRYRGQQAERRQQLEVIQDDQRLARDD